jgi:ribA/ribD-fused uncharacterized protein
MEKRREEGKIMLIETTTIFFYRAAGESGYLSNLFPAEIEFEGKKFATAEHAYQYGKFADKTIADWVMTAPKPHLVAILAHGLFSWDVAKGWAAKKVDRMKAVVSAKFAQHPELQTKLLETHQANLVENSNMDPFWGLGKKGTGKNMLGKILMEVRAHIRTKLLESVSSS